MADKVVTRAFKTSVIERFIASIGNTIDDSVYYVFYGDHVTSGNTQPDVQKIDDSIRSTRINPYRSMIAGKRLQQNNVLPLVRRHTWESGRVYDMYDDVDDNLFNKPFFVTVEGEAGQDAHVFKCLFNNNGALTTEEPSISTVINNNDEYYETADGYQWKYMYTIPSNIFRDFKTEKFIPVVDYTPPQLTKNIVPGAIDVVAVDSPGAGYNNYFPTSDSRVKSITNATQTNPVVITSVGHGLQTGDAVRITEIEGMIELNNRTFSITRIDNNQFSLQDENGTGHSAYTVGGLFTTFEGRFTSIQFDGQARVYGIRSNGIAGNFYKNTIISLIQGPGSQDGAFRKIISSQYDVQTDQVLLTLDDAFAITPQLNTRFVITPEVKIFGNGNETITATARAIINTAANSINAVEVLNPGENYDFATARVLLGGQANSIGGTVGLFETVEAAVRPIIGPRGGHSSNPSYELGATNLGISIKLANTENNTIPAENTFAQFGIIKNPEFINIKLGHRRISNTQIEGSDGDFVDGEDVIQFNRLAICGNVNLLVFTGNTTHTVKAPIDFPTPGYDQIIESGDKIYIRDRSDEELRHHIGEVISVNADHVVARGVPSWSENITVPYDAANTQTIPKTQMFLVNEISKGKIVEGGIPGTRDSITLRNVVRPFVLNKQIIGTESFAVANVSLIDTNERFESQSVNYNFETFIQATRCEGNILAGPTSSFQEDELVTQSDPGGRITVEARIHSVNNNVILLTDVDEGQINTAIQLVGSLSGAVLQPPFSKTEGDLDTVTGEIVFLENNVPVRRESNQSEQIRVILEF